MDCRVYRCGRQADMYLYLHTDRQPDDLPEALRQRTGALTEVMQLTLTPERRLARVDTTRVIAALEGEGYFLQLPPNGQLEAHLYFGD